MKKLLAKLSAISFMIMITLSNVAFAAETEAERLAREALEKAEADKIGSTLSIIQGKINAVAWPVASFLIFIGVLMVGFTIIKNRDNAEERTKSMESILWLGIGAFVVGAAVAILPALTSIKMQ